MTLKQVFAAASESFSGLPGKQTSWRKSDSTLVKHMLVPVKNK